MFGAVAECIGIISYRTVYAVVFGQHLYKLTQDIVGLFDAFFVSTVISEGFISLLRRPSISQKWPRTGIASLPCDSDEARRYLCHKQFSVEFEDFLVPFLPDRLYGTVVDMHNGIPCILLHLDHAL